MLVIATDEAGYGPKLGPLVIAGTVWRFEEDSNKRMNSASLKDKFAPMCDPCRCGDILVKVDDSKAVYKLSAGLDSLHAVVSASLHWCGRKEPTFREWLCHAASVDRGSLAACDWLQQSGEETRWLSREATETCLHQWGSQGISLLGIQYRVITAEAFNRACTSGSNKADLLSESTLNLIGSLLRKWGNAEEACEVFCDRHGGRRYYAGVIQHCFPDSLVQVVREEKGESEYELAGVSGKDGTMGPTSIRFTVKGDSFTPVALASMHAKYVREQLMNSLNHYFATLAAAELRPTAGYPVDADRFLADIASILEREGIDRERLVRSR